MRLLQIITIFSGIWYGTLDIAIAKVDLSYPIGLIIHVNTFVNILIPLLIGVAVLFFVFNLTVFISRSDNDEARAIARHQMVWGVIAIFVLTALWGLVGVLLDFFMPPSFHPITPYVTF